MNKQTYLEGSAIENAVVMLDACRTEYERAGHAGAVMALRGLDVTSAASAHLALITMHGLPTPEGLKDLHQCAMNALQQAYASFQTMRLAS